MYKVKGLNIKVNEETIFDEKDDYQFTTDKRIEGVTDDGVVELFIEQSQYVNDLAGISKITYGHMKDNRKVFTNIEDEFDEFFDEVQAYEFFNS